MNLLPWNLDYSTKIPPMLHDTHPHVCIPQGVSTNNFQNGLQRIRLTSIPTLSLSCYLDIGHGHIILPSENISNTLHLAFISNPSQA